jgi:NADH-quinone oxidoreductase subunit A
MQLQAYLPALVFLGIGLLIGLVLVHASRLLAPRRPVRAKVEPYECGLPSDFRYGFRFGISFYLVAILFLIFDIEVLLLFPTSVVLRELGMHALIAIGVFIGLLGIAFLYEYKRGALSWRE